MSTKTLFVLITLFCLLPCGRVANAQASEQLKQRTKEMGTAQERSWQQVDQINRETDQTRARLQQARRSGETAYERSGYTVKKTEVGTRGAYKKPKHQNTDRLKRK